MEAIFHFEWLLLHKPRLKKIKIKRASSDRRIFFKRITQPLTFSLKKSVKLKHRIKRWMNFKKECIFEIPGKFCIITSRWMFWVFLSQTKCLFVNCVFLYIRYSKFWNIYLEPFIEHKPFISEEWGDDVMHFGNKLLLLVIFFCPQKSSYTNSVYVRS